MALRIWRIKFNSLHYLYLTQIALFTTSALQTRQNGEKVTEYCLDEDFEARCLKNEIVAVTTAVFGRMKFGRCLRSEREIITEQLENNPKYIGCRADVTKLVDAKCAGRNHCTVRPFNDIELKIEKPCHDALKNYLEISYECLEVVEPDRSCTVSVTSSAQHLMTSHSSSTKLSCGSRYQPWKLEAPAGQQINVSLLDFGEAVNKRERDSCLQYGYIIDREAKKNISICGLVSQRKRNIYASVSNTLEAVLSVNFEDIEGSGFSVLLRVKATGCSDLTPPEDMWLRRRNLEAVVGCYSSRQTWYLNCVNNQWSGVIGNCTREKAELVVGELKQKNSSMEGTTGIVATGIVLVGLIICVAIILIGFVCIKRYNSKLIHSQKLTHNDINRDWKTTPYIQQSLIHPQA